MILAAGGDEQGFAFWDLESGELVRGAGFDDPYLAAITEVRGEGPPLFVTATQYADEIHVWGLSDEHGGDLICDPLTGHEDAVVALDTAVIGDRVLAVSGGEDATVFQTLAR